MLSSDIIFIALFIGAHSSSLSKIILTQKTIQVKFFLQSRSIKSQL